MATKTICAVSSGIVIDVIVSAGAEVAAGDELLICESMKMEIPIEAPCAGVVQRILIEVGQSVVENDPLIELAI